MSFVPRERLKYIEQCPGFGQDRVNFHRTPGRGTAGGWGLTPPGQTEPGVPYPVPSRWVPGRGGGGAAQRSGNWLSRLGGTRLRCCAGERLSGSCGSLLCFLLICTVVVPVCLFAVLLNCPYPDPPVSASFFPFSSARRRGEGRPRGAFVAGGSRNQNKQLTSLGSSLFFPLLVNFSSLFSSLALSNTKDNVMISSLSGLMFWARAGQLLVSCHTSPWCLHSLIFSPCFFSSVSLSGSHLSSSLQPLP